MTAIRQIRDARPAIPVLVLSQFLEDRDAIELLDGRPEGKGYLLKDRIADTETFVDAVRRVARGGSVTVSAVERHVTNIFSRLGLPRDAQEHRRVLAVLQYLRADPSLAAPVR